ncbi:hypothetical protein L1887_48320 [Cichorium endivia]|nr:hypothetical protein L1887_48320 [Cichorium endivia]
MMEGLLGRVREGSGTQRRKHELKPCARILEYWAGVGSAKSKVEETLRMFWASRQMLCRSVEHRKNDTLDEAGPRRCWCCQANASDEATQPPAKPGPQRHSLRHTSSASCRIRSG